MTRRCLPRCWSPISPSSSSRTGMAGDAGGFGGLLRCQQRVLGNDGDALPVGHRRGHLDQGIEHRPWYLDAAAVGSDQGRLRFRNGYPAPDSSATKSTTSASWLPSRRYVVASPLAAHVLVSVPLAAAYLQDSSSTKKTKTPAGWARCCRGPCAAARASAGLAFRPGGELPAVSLARYAAARRSTSGTGSA